MHTLVSFHIPPEIRKLIINLIIIKKCTSLMIHEFKKTRDGEAPSLTVAMDIQIWISIYIKKFALKA